MPLTTDELLAAAGLTACLLLALVPAEIASRWAGDLGYGRGRRAVWFTLGFLSPPLALVFLYLRQARHRAVVAVG